jgi:hypothetical protein
MKSASVRPEAVTIGFGHTTAGSFVIERNADASMRKSIIFNVQVSDGSAWIDKRIDLSEL